MARRENEFKEAQNLKYINAHRNVSHVAHWEAKTDKMVEKNLVRSRLADLKKRQACNLEDRRGKLAAMLADEDACYE